MALAAGMAWQVWHTGIPHTFRGEWGPKVTTVSWRDRTINPILHKDASPEERACLASRDGVMCLAFNYGVYALAQPDFSRRVEATRVIDPEALLDLMRRKECRWLLLVNVDDSVAVTLRPAVADGHLRLVCPGWLERTGR
jgi:hypothetical protein